MRLSQETLKKAEEHDVRPGNVYPAKGGRKTPGTEWWLVVAVSNTGAHCLGFNNEGAVCSATTYLKSAMRERPIVGRVDLSAIKLETLAEKP